MYVTAILRVLFKITGSDVDAAERSFVAQGHKKESHKKAQKTQEHELDSFSLMRSFAADPVQRKVCVFLCLFVAIMAAWLFHTDN
jgi:hypothetical protein